MSFIFGAIVVASSAQATEIRIKNVSQYDYEDLEVGGKEFGLLKVGQFTEYETFKVAHHYEMAYLKIDGKDFHFQPRDFIGEEPLGDGCFTYLVGLADPEREGEFEGFNGSVSANATRDEFVDFRGGLSVKAVKEKCPAK